MAKKTVVEIKCDRCDRVEYSETFTPVGKAIPAMKMTFRDRVIEWGDLCSSCDKAVTNYVKQLMREKDAKENVEDGGGP